MEERLLAALTLPSGDATTGESGDDKGMPAQAPEAPGFALADDPGPGDDDDDDDDPPAGGGGNIDPDDDEGYGDDDDDDDDEETLQVCPPRSSGPRERKTSSHCSISW